MKGMFNGFDYFAIVAEVRITKFWNLKGVGKRDLQVRDCMTSFMQMYRKKNKFLKE